MQALLGNRTGFEEREDPFVLWCKANNIGEKDQPAAFKRYLWETSRLDWADRLDIPGE